MNYAMIILCALLTAGTTFGTGAASAAAPGQVACVYDLAGEVSVQKTGSAAWLTAGKGLPLAEGDKVRTGSTAWCEILFKDGTFIKLDSDSETAAETVKITAEERSLSFSFLKGKALWMAAKLKKKIASKFSVHTPSAVCAVRGTDFSIAVSTSGETAIGLFNGVVALSNDSGEKELLPGGEASAGTGGIAVKDRFSTLMRAEEKRYIRIKGRVDSLRKRLEERNDFIDDYVSRQEKKLSDFEQRRQEKLKKR